MYGREESLSHDDLCDKEHEPVMIFLRGSALAGVNKERSSHGVPPASLSVELDLIHHPTRGDHDDPGQLNLRSNL